MPGKKNLNQENLRQRAEKLVHQPEKNARALSCEEIDRLTQELAVHQVELEIQNQDLRETQQSLLAARDRYAELYNSAPVGYVTLDKHNHIIEANTTLCRMLEQGNLQTGVVQHRFTEFVRSDSQDKFYLFLNRLQHSQENQKEVGEIRMQSTSGKVSFYARLEGLRNQEGLHIAVIDITDIKLAEEALARAKLELEETVEKRTRELAESEEKYRLLVENANEAVIVFQDNREKFFNRKAIELSGYSAEELAAKPILEFIYPEDRAMVMDRYQKRLQGEEVPSTYEFRMIHKNGGIMWVQINAVRINWSGKPAVLGLMTDITERNNMEQELKAYARRITQVQEAERKRIAYELHDDTAQYLSILKLELDALLQSGKIKDPIVLDKLQYLEKDASRAFDDVRRYSHELRPGVLEHLGLQAALEQIADDINRLKQISVEVSVEGEEPEIPEEIKLAFFRIAQEALNNARKHAKASTANINLHYNTRHAKMVIKDNGVGFNTKKSQTRSTLQGSLGLTSMQERAKLIGADLKIESRPGTGTSVIVETTI